MMYQADHFGPTYRRAAGEELWRFLNRADNVQRMETATELRAPAIAGVERALSDKFGRTLAPLRVKQMVGHMIRQIMERRGYTLDAVRVNVRTGGVFATGARYRKTRPSDGG